MPAHAPRANRTAKATQSSKGKLAPKATRAARRKESAPKAEWSFGPSLAGAAGVPALQTALEVGPSGDEFEQEADRVADHVLRMPESAVAGSGGNEGGDDELQRKPASTMPDEETTAQAAPIQRACAECQDEEPPSGVQTKLQRAEKIEDESLQRAEKMEDESVQRAEMDDEDVQRACASCDDEKAQRAEMDDENVQRAEMDDENVQRQDDVFSSPPPVAEDEETTPAAAVQPKGARPRRAHKKPTPAPPAFAERLADARRGGGVELPMPLRAFMETRFGTSFERVRVHHDSAASRLADRIQARAFTVGRHLFFNRGEFQPHTQQGQRLVAHELTHVLQQRGGLHSVQREVFERDGLERAGNDEESVREAEEREAETLSFKKLADFFGWRDDALPPLVFETLKDLVERALHVMTFRESLAVFVLGKPLDESIRRIVQSPSQKLRLEVEQRGDTPQAATRWELEFLDGMRGPATGGQPVTIGTDEDSVSVPGPKPAPQTPPPAEVAPGPSAPAPTGSATNTSIDKPAAASATKADQPETTAGGEAAPKGAAEGKAPAGAAPAAEEAAFPKSPEEDPNFQAVTQGAGSAAATTSEHSEGGELAANAKDAASVTPGEQQSKAQGNKTDQMQGAKTPGFNKEAFVQAVLDKVRGTAPKTIADAGNYARDHGPGLANTVNQAAATQTDKTSAELKTVTDAAPNTGAVPARAGVELKPEAVGAPPADIKAERAVPPVQPQSQVEGAAQQNKDEAEKQIADLGYTNAEETFANSGDPEMMATLDAKKSFDTDVAAGPGEFREGEETLRTEAATDAGALGQEKLGAMFATREGKLGAVTGKQRGGKSDSETKRQEVVAEVNRIFTGTETKVKNRLTALKDTVFKTFQAESQRALNTFTQRVVGVEKRWEERGFFGQIGNKISSAFQGIPNELEAGLQTARDEFIAEMTRIVERIAVTVEQELKLAKDDIAAGRAELKKFLDGLDPSLKTLKEQLSAEFEGKFGALETEVKNTEAGLVTGLAEQFKARLAESDKLAEEIRDRNRDFFDVLAAGIKFVRDKTVGLIEKLNQVFKDGAETLMKVLDDPKKFAKNFLAGIKLGIDNFSANILTHLKAGLIEWLTGAAGGAGITLPTSFDTKGIIGFILQLLGLTVENVKARARIIWGEKVVRAIEMGIEGAKKAIEIFTILQTQGLSGLFDFLQAKFEELKELALEKIKTAISLELVKAAVKKIATLLVPGGAFLQAVLSIIDAVFFFINNADRIAALIQTITNAVKDILAGNISALAAKVEAVLASTIPIVLDFLATLLGIGSKIQGVVKDALAAIRAPVTAAIDAILLGIKNVVVGLIDKIVGKKEEAGEAPKPGTPMTEEQIIAAVVPKLHQPTKATDPAQALAEKKAQAETLKQQFQPSAPGGKTLKITFNDATGEDVAKDHEVDMEVGFSPGTPVTAAVASDKPLAERFEKEIGASHAKALEAVKKAVVNVPPEKAPTLVDFAQVRAELANVTPTRDLIARPLLADTAYGVHMSRLLSTAFNTVNKREPTEGELTAAKGRVHGGEGAFQDALALLRAAIFDQSASEGAIQTSLETALQAEGTDKPDPKLLEGIAKAGGVIPFLKGVPSGSTMSFVDFSAAWNKTPDRNHVKGLIRDENKRVAGGGTHEWIPLQTIVEIVDPETFANSPADAPTAAEWLDVQQKWVSLTEQVMFKPSMAQLRTVGVAEGFPQPTEPQTGLRKVIQGHPGAVWHVVDGENVQQTVGSPGFHEELVGIISGNFRSGPGAVGRKILKVAEDTLWQGGDASEGAFSNEHRGSGGNIVPLPNLESQAKAGFNTISGQLRNDFKL